MSSATAPTGSTPSGIWTVHSETGGKPGLRAFARTKAEAERLMAGFKIGDEDAAAQYWVIELTNDQLGDFRDAGLVPDGI